MNRSSYRSRSTRLPLFVYLTLVALHFVQLAVYAPRLPDPVVSHFNAQGIGDGWMSRPAFLALMAGLTALHLLLFLGVSWLIRRLPRSAINLPNKEYWLSPGRDRDTRRELGGRIYWFAAATQLLLLATCQLTIEINLGLRAGLGREAWSIVGLYVLFTIWFCFDLYRRYSGRGSPTVR